MLTLQRAVKLANSQNVYQILQSSGLRGEEQLAVLAVRLLSPQEVLHSVERLKDIIASTIQEGGCGNDCGHGCGTNCGNSCGVSCGTNCWPAAGKLLGAFCGGGCAAVPGVMGVVDVSGKLDVDFCTTDISKLITATEQAMELVGYHNG
jgi:hypothetical protein